MTDTPMLPNTWATVDRPVLVAIVKMFQEGLETEATADGIRRATDTLLTNDEVALAVRRLNDAYIEVRWVVSNAPIFRVMRVYESALREVGVWPSAESLYDALKNELEQRIADTTDEDERTRLQKFRDGVLSVSRDVGIGVMQAVVIKQITG